MRFLLSVLTFSACAAAQPVIGAAGYVVPVPVAGAPGQVITLFVQNAGAVPAMADVSAVFHQFSDIAMPVLDVRGLCGVPDVPACAATTVGVTVQIPYGIQVACALCERPELPLATMSVSVKGVSSGLLAVQTLPDQVHFLTQCDIIAGGSFANTSGLPCAPMVTHADGTVVNGASPAKSGEELVAYATGLGETIPPLTTGKPAPTAYPTQTAFFVDFNYRPNALATKPAPPPPYSAAPPPDALLFTGTTAGFVGLYQINFVVPPVPPGLPPCVPAGGAAAFANVVQSNLTVSIGSDFSFDGAGICVQPGS